MNLWAWIVFFVAMGVLIVAPLVLFGRWLQRKGESLEKSRKDASR
jgi:membrane-anchored protein YejM (alkaline phosphatase superfamily)